MKITRKDKILVAGGGGFLGTHLLAELKKRKYTNVWAPTKKDVDLLSSRQCEKALKGVDVVINTAGKLGGTMDNKEHPADYFYENVMTGMNLLHASRKESLKKFVQIGSVISYPSNANKYPLTEDKLWDGYPDEVKEGYAMAKKFLLVMGKTYQKQYSVPVIHLMLTNMYGPGDHYKASNAHVVPALIDRFAEAKSTNKSEVVVWGTGKATRDFLYVKEAAIGIINAMQRYSDTQPINMASGQEVSIKELAEAIAKHMEYSGKLTWDKTKPDGQLRSSYNISKARKAFGFKPSTSIDEGIKKTVEWYKKNISD
jgi:GDP-L-fucose synthase